MICRWIKLSQRVQDAVPLPKTCYSSGPKSFLAEVSAGSYHRLEVMKRSQYLPKGWLESIEAAPPFSRAAMWLFCAGLSISSFITLTSPSPLIVSRSTRYHLRICSAGILYFTGEDFAAAIVGRSTCWGHRKFESGISVLLTGLQVLLTSQILTTDCLTQSKTSGYAALWSLTCFQTACTIILCPKWIAYSRLIFYSLSIATLPLVAFRTRSILLNSEKLILSDFQIT